MTDLTYCYLHKTPYDLQVLDTLETPYYLKGELSDDDLDIPLHMVPPNPDDSDILPSRVHPSYPYGNPTDIKHPASRPRLPSASRALFEDKGYGDGGINGHGWPELAQDSLLPQNKGKAEEEEAENARKMAGGGVPNHAPQPAAGRGLTGRGEDGRGEDGRENDEGEEEDGDEDEEQEPEPEEEPEEEQEEEQGEESGDEDGEEESNGEDQALVLPHSRELRGRG